MKRFVLITAVFLAAFAAGRSSATIDTGVIRLPAKPSRWTVPFHPVPDEARAAVLHGPNCGWRSAGASA